MAECTECGNMFEDDGPASICPSCIEANTGEPCDYCGQRPGATGCACDDYEDERDDAYERAAARARGNDFADTDGKDWT